MTSLHLKGFISNVVLGFHNLLKQNCYSSVLYELSVVLK